MSSRHKNLSKQDLEDLKNYESKSINLNSSIKSFSIKDIKIDIKYLNSKQKDLAKAIKQKDIIIASGPAGTGKTMITLATALHILQINNTIDKIILFKSIIQLQDEALGFIKGTVQDKLEPTLEAFTGNLEKIVKSKLIVRDLMNTNIIEPRAISFVRGSSIDNAIIIVDETQNLSLHTFRTLITRLGTNSKIIFLGDTEQIDRKDKQNSCLNRIINIFKEQEFVEVINFTLEEVVRNPLITKILKLLENEK